ncbi:hypothetical protein [Pseudochryseolinea flava]|uniref:Zinc-ribbon 15 domain-containing protein n=1 Tax=Pseudochryseolinea flava TaxID=2059302 RepID=A0A364Y3B4_9BACT|nr:hypothetical protein [Pseudochryseolinea flava]RAW00276.1 hypothetical protein DQQ10_14555 [Pseudochryseolinea flava]
MIFIFGRKRAKIKKAFDHVGSCTSCNSIGVQFEIFRDYYHLFWIPIFPVGDKETEGRCTQCGKPNNYNPRAKHFESVTRTPIYLYAGVLFFLILIGSLVVGNINTQKEKALFIADPKAGDVYLMRKDVNDSTYYFFLRVARIQSDTVIVYPNVFQYFGFITKMDDQDHFIAQEFYYTKNELSELLEKGEINSVERDYGDYKGFNRIVDLKVDSVK